MQDITGAKDLEIDIRNDGKVVWINVDAATVLRVCRIDNLIVTDRRNCHE